MGGLRKHLPITYATMLIATLAISAIPPFAGFFSKDMILDAAYNSGHVWLWILGIVTAAMTSFYMFRLIFMTFHGDSRVDPEKAHHIHESPPVMTIPLIVLAVLAIIGGWVGLPDGLLWGDAFSAFLAPSVGEFCAPFLHGSFVDADQRLARPRRASESCWPGISTSRRRACRTCIAYQAQSRLQRACSTSITSTISTISIVYAAAVLDFHLRARRRHRLTS